MTDPADIASRDSSATPQPHGLLVLDKPPGPSSYDCIRSLRRSCSLSRKWKMGHLGTLDPFASGVLVIALGRAVRYAEYALGSRKKYRARLWLGEETDTLDPTGKVIRAAPIPPDWTDRLREIIPSFVGRMEQVPPLYSAKQVNGRRSYKAARRGESIDLSPAEVEIFSLEIADTGENYLDFTTEVSGGTYIRSLGRDIALALGTVGHLVGLERLAAGPFTIGDAIPLRAFEVGGSHVLEHHLHPVDRILDHLPSCRARDGAQEKIAHGRILHRDDLADDLSCVVGGPDAIRIVDSEGRFLSLGRMRNDPAGVVPFKQWEIEHAS